jgi:hypothetical protein
MSIMIDRRLIKYSPGAAARSETRSFASLETTDDVRLCYGTPEVRGLDEYLKRRRVAQIHARALARHRKYFDS